MSKTYYALENRAFDAIRLVSSFETMRSLEGSSFWQFKSFGWFNLNFNIGNDEFVDISRQLYKQAKCNKKQSAKLSKEVS